MQRTPVRPPRLHCEAVLSPGASVELPERAVRHVAALRLQRGDEVVLFNGDGAESSATLVTLGRRGVVAAVRERRAIDRESLFEVHLAQGICAGDRMDLVLQKATELGVASIQPIATARSIVRLARERRERRETHWQNVVIAACEQCGRNLIPPVAPSTGLPEFVALPARGGTRILLAPDGEATLRALAPRAPMTVLIGPEGGLAPEERELAAARGFTPVRFGPRILRTETAPLAALAALQALYGDC
jgi:16S rRNA (uracil1498-N3)-methyltransferase